MTIKRKRGEGEESLVEAVREASRNCMARCHELEARLEAVRGSIGRLLALYDHFEVFQGARGTLQNSVLANEREASRQCMALCHELEASLEAQRKSIGRLLALYDHFEVLQGSQGRIPNCVLAKERETDSSEPASNPSRTGESSELDRILIGMGGRMQGIRHYDDDEETVSDARCSQAS